MAKKVQWVKVMADMNDNPKLKYIDSLEDNNLIYYIWTSSILAAGKSNRDGELYLSNNIPYTIKTLAIEFRRTEDEVKKAYKILRKLEMIELTCDKVFYLPGWSEYQSVDGLEKIRKQTNERVQKYREKKREEKKAAEESKKSEDNNAFKSDVKQNEDYSTGENAESNAENDINGNEEVIIDANKQDSNTTDGDKCHDYNAPNESITKNNKVTCNAEDSVTNEELSVTATTQNKKETEKKKTISDTNSKYREKDKYNNSVSQSKNITHTAIELAAYSEKLTGRIGLLDIDSLNMAIELHGSDNVKKAIEKSIECKKINMRYILGILKNWRVEGYPSGEDEALCTTVNKKNYGGGKSYGGKCNSKGAGKDTDKFDSFKPNEPRKLTEAERKKASADVI